jgi:hypothetical protein
MEYTKTVPATGRRFAQSADGFKPAVKFQSFSANIFSHIEQQTSSEKVLASLGYNSLKYENMGTNSKSGSFFFKSCDARYIIKSLKKDEAAKLYEMLPTYQEHIRANPNSLICRFAGLYGFTNKHSTVYFIVMASVFDPKWFGKKTGMTKDPRYMTATVGSTYPVMFDLKGSLQGRNKSKADDVGKDLDWIEDGRRLELKPEQRRELLEQHESDVKFLNGFRVMDYSVLIGIRERSLCRESIREREEAGIDESSNGTTSLSASGRRNDYRMWDSKDGKEVYYIGLIDFFIEYDDKKMVEHTMRAIQGYAETTSAVDNDTYASRQVDFVRERVVDSEALVDQGTCGTLTVLVKSATKLIRADSFGRSDPYCKVSLGLRCQRTPTIRYSLDPEWNCTLRLPVINDDKESAGDSRFKIKLSVWDQDHKLSQGDDDFLGDITIPFNSLLTAKNKKILLNGEKLAGVKKGSLMAELNYTPFDASASCCPFEPESAKWEWCYRKDSKDSHKDVYREYEPDAQRSLEVQWQAFKNGTGSSAVRVVTGVHRVRVNLQTWTQQVETNLGRERRVRRTKR